MVAPHAFGEPGMRLGWYLDVHQHPGFDSISPPHLGEQVYPTQGGSSTSDDLTKLLIEEPIAAVTIDIRMSAGKQSWRKNGK